MAEQHQDSHGHSAVQVDEQQLPNLQLFGWGLVVAVVFFGGAGFINTVFYPLMASIQEERLVQESDRTPQVRQARAAQERQLSTYGYTDQAKGLAHIPITEGMKKVIEEAKR